MRLSCEHHGECLLPATALSYSWQFRRRDLWIYVGGASYKEAALDRNVACWRRVPGGVTGICGIAEATCFPLGVVLAACVATHLTRSDRLRAVTIFPRASDQSTNRANEQLRGRGGFAGNAQLNVTAILTATSTAVTLDELPGAQLILVTGLSGPRPSKQINDFLQPRNNDRAHRSTFDAATSGGTCRENASSTAHAQLIKRSASWRCKFGDL